MSPKAQKRKETLQKKLNDKQFMSKLSYDHSHDKITDEEDTRPRIE